MVAWFTPSRDAAPDKLPERRNSNTSRIVFQSVIMDCILAHLAFPNVQYRKEASPARSLAHPLKEVLMPHYVSVQITVKDPEALETYRGKAMDALAKHGGAPFAGGPQAEVLEDTGAGPATALVIEFPDGDAARGWINDPDLADIHALRQKGAQTMITLLPPLGA
jgi:uncharacterized protein (DUF1330 family)